MEKFVKKLLDYLHGKIGKETEIGERIITRKLADSLFITELEAQQLHEEYHKSKPESGGAR